MSESEHIFVLGPPRSGTTLPKNVVQWRTDVCGSEGESWVFLRSHYADVCLPGISADTEARIVQTSRSVTGLFDRWTDAVKKRTGETYFLEKTPESALRLDYVISHFPESHIVFIARDPRDGLRSARDFPGYWATLPDADRVGGYLATWKRSVRAYLHHAEHKTMIRVRYEDFCQEPEAQLSGLSDKIGIEVQDHQLDPAAYGETEVSMHEAHSRLRQPITPDSIGRWRQELSKDEVARIERTLADEMKALDYGLTLE